jgi:hypothetical protein
MNKRPLTYFYRDWYILVHPFKHGCVMLQYRQFKRVYVDLTLFNALRQFKTDIKKRDSLARLFELKQLSEAKKATTKTYIKGYY